VPRLIVETWADEGWVDISGRVLDDGWSIGWDLNRSTYRFGKLRIEGGLPWGVTELRTLGEDDDGGRHPLGVFVPRSPRRDPGSDPEVFDVDLFDRTAKLRWSPGSSVQLLVGDPVLAFVDGLVSGEGTTILDPTAAAVTASQIQLFLLEPQATRLFIANAALASIGYRPLWADPETGSFRSIPDAPLGDLSPVHVFDTTLPGILSRQVVSDDWDVPNRWLGVIDNPAVTTPIVFVLNNESEGRTSQDQVGVRAVPVRVEAQTLADLELLVRSEASRQMRAVDEVTIVSDWVPEVTSRHVCAVRVDDPAIPLNRVCVVESWSLSSGFTQTTKVAPPPQAFAAGVGMSPPVAREALGGSGRRTDFSARVQSTTSGVDVRVTGDTVDVSAPLVNSGLTLATNDTVSLVKVGTSWVIQAKVAAP